MYTFKNLIYIILIFLFSCNGFNKKSETPPSWMKALAIYEIMPKNFSPKQNINSIIEDLSKIKMLYVTAISLAPITPCDAINSSYNPNDAYASIDFTELDAGLGTKNDLKNLVTQAHQNQLKVLLQFEISYTGVNHPWRTKHPEYYQSSEQKINDLYNPKYIKLDYTNKKVRSNIIKALKYWKSNFDIDGLVIQNTEDLPADFCEELSQNLKSDEFLLASGSQCPQMVKDNIFDSYYNNNLYQTLKKISNNEANASMFKEIIADNRNQKYKSTVINYTRNSKINEAEPSEHQQWPYFYKLPMIITTLIGGVPMIMNGQEDPMFIKIDVKKPTFVTREYQYNVEFFRSLFIHRKENGALYSLEENLPELISDSENVLAFERKIGSASVVLLANLRDSTSSFQISRSYNQYVEFFTRAVVSFQQGQEYKLGPHQYLMLTNKH